MNEARRASMLEILNRARVLICEPKSWSKMSMARDEHGIGCDPAGPYAKSFCLLGAVHRADTEFRAYIYSDVIMQLQRDLRMAPNWSPRSGGLADYNDGGNRTHEEVLALLDNTIERLSEKETASA